MLNSHPAIKNRKLVNAGRDGQIPSNHRRYGNAAVGGIGSLAR